MFEVLFCGLCMQKVSVGSRRKVFFWAGETHPSLWDVEFYDHIIPQNVNNGFRIQEERLIGDGPMDWHPIWADNKNEPLTSISHIASCIQLYPASFSGANTNSTRNQNEHRERSKDQLGGPFAATVFNGVHPRNNEESFFLFFKCASSYHTWYTVS